MPRSPLTFGILLMAALALAGVAVAASGPPAAGPRSLAIRELRFEPDDLALSPGDSVTWTNEDVVPHTVTAADGSWDSGELAPGERWTVVVEGDGAVPYLCRYHPTMRGSLELRP